MLGNLVTNVYNSLDQIDKSIQERAANWEMKRMAAIDQKYYPLGCCRDDYFPMMCRLKLLLMKLLNWQKLLEAMTVVNL